MGEIGLEDTDTAAETVFSNFRLPEDMFGEMMFERRLERSHSSTPAALNEGLQGRTRDSTIEDTEGAHRPNILLQSLHYLNLTTVQSEPRSSPPLSRGALKATRRGRGSRGVRGRSRVNESAARGTRGKVEEEESAEDEDEEEASEEDENEEEEQESAKSTPPARRGRRGRSARGGRGRPGRGRGGRRK